MSLSTTSTCLWNTSTDSDSITSLGSLFTTPRKTFLFIGTARKEAGRPESKASPQSKMPAGPQAPVPDWAYTEGTGECVLGYLSLAINLETIWLKVLEVKWQTNSGGRKMEWEEISQMLLFDFLCDWALAIQRNPAAKVLEFFVIITVSQCQCSPSMETRMMFFNVILSVYNLWCGWTLW